MLFRSKSKESANGVGVELEDYAMVRYLCEVDESHFHAHVDKACEVILTRNGERLRSWGMQDTN